MVHVDIGEYCLPAEIPQVTGLEQNPLPLVLESEIEILGVLRFAVAYCTVEVPRSALSSQTRESDPTLEYRQTPPSIVRVAIEYANPAAHYRVIRPEQSAWKRG